MIARICVVLMFAFSLVPCCIAQLPAGLVAGFGFDEGTGTTASDSSGNGNIAALRNGVTWTAGHFGNGLAFDGTSGYLSMPNSPSLDISGNGLTLSLWINPQPLNGGDSVVFGKFWNTTMTSPFYQYGLELNGGNRPFFFIGTNSGFLYADMGSTLAYGQWTHLAITFDGSQASFYRNGTLINSVPLAATIQARGNSINVGADITPAQFFKGSMDELKIYGRSLSPAEVLTDMNTALP
jgi:hypothetical protein